MSDGANNLKNPVFNSDRSDWDVDEIVRQVSTDLNGSVPQASIQQTVTRLLASFADAPVKTFVPIFVRREALDLLIQESANGD